jgi:hypothetical protein
MNWKVFEWRLSRVINAVSWNLFVGPEGNHKNQVCSFLSDIETEILVE